MSRKNRREDWRNLIRKMLDPDPEVRCHSYRSLKIGMQRGLRVKEPFSILLADCIRSECYSHLQSLLELVETYITSHKETLSRDNKGYPIFKAFLYKFHEHVESCLNIMFLNHALIHIIETFPNKYLLLLTIKLFGEAPHPINVTLRGLYVAQSVTKVTGKEFSLITLLTPFEVLRAACISLMDLVNTYKAYPELDVYQWSEDMLVALWFINRSQMMDVFKSLPADVQKEVASMIKNYGSTKYGVLESKLPLEMEAMIEHIEVDVQSKCDKCDWSTKAVSVQERSSSIPGTSSKDSLPTQIYDEPKPVRPVFECVLPDVYLAVMEEDSTQEEPHVDATKSETSVFGGNKVAARQSILNLSKHPDVLPGSNEDLSKLALDVKKGENEHELLHENQQNQKVKQDNYKLTEEHKQEELNGLQSTSNMNRESCEADVKMSPKIQEETAEATKCETDFDRTYEIEERPQEETAEAIKCETEFETTYEIEEKPQEETAEAIKCETEFETTYEIEEKPQEETAEAIKCETDFDTTYEIEENPQEETAEAIKCETEFETTYEIEENPQEETAEAIKCETEFETTYEIEENPQEETAEAIKCETDFETTYEIEERPQEETAEAIKCETEFETSYDIEERNKEETAEEIKCETDFDTDYDIESEIEEVKYDTEDSLGYEEPTEQNIEEITVEKVFQRLKELKIEYEEIDEENEIENKDSFLPDSSTQWESAERGEPSGLGATASGTAPVATASRSPLVATASGTAPIATDSGTTVKQAANVFGSPSVSRIKSIMNIPSKITSLFKGRGFKSQTTISEQRVDVLDSMNSSARMYTEAQKLVRDEIESVIKDIYHCKIEINSTELEIEQLQLKIRNNNMIIQKKLKKLKEKFSVANF